MEKLLEIFDLLGIPAFLLDHRDNILSINHTASTLFSLEHQACRLCDILPDIEFLSDSEIFIKNTLQGFYAGKIISFSIDSSKKILGLQDITEQKIGELVNELSWIVNSSLSIGTIFRIMASEIKRFISYDRASLLLYDERTEKLTIYALDTKLNTVLKKGVKAPVYNTSAGWVVQNNRPWINYDLETDLRFELDRKLLAEGIRSTISIPLYKDRILGVFNLDSKERNRYSEKDLKILNPVAKHISIALENALLFEELTKEKKEWERTFDAITDMVWIEDRSQKVIRANQALLARTGYSAMAIRGVNCRELLGRIGVITETCLCLDTLITKRTSFKELKGTGGRAFHFWAYPLIDEDGRLYAIVHYLKDVTSQKLMEQHLIKTEKLASLGTLAAGVAHEINNPLTAIATCAEALIERSRTERLRNLKEFEDFPEYLEIIQREIFRCKEILQSLLEFARPSGTTFREIDINEIIKEVILLVKWRAKTLRHNIELKLQRDIPKIRGNAGNLRQVFLNIILNSLYFTPELGTITVQTEIDHSIDQRFRGHTLPIKITIRDTGTGIPDEIKDRIFDPFFTTKPVGEGTGLGLSISHRIIEEHGGTIDVESTPGEGTTVIVKLPAMEPAYD